MPEAEPPIEPIATRARALRGRGAGHFDPVGLDLVDALLARARELEAPAAERLRARAAEHLARLEAAHGAALERAEAALAAREAADGAVADTLRETLATGDAVAVLQALRARPRGTIAPDDRRRRARARYRAALADLETALGHDRVAPPEEHAGLLNGAELAARVLAEAERVSPAWRRSLVASLLDLSALLHLPEPPPPRKAR